MENRNEFGDLLSNSQLLTCGVEVGTFKGDFSKEILKKWPGTLYMVDIWRPLPNEKYDDITNNAHHVDAYKDAMNNINDYVDRAHMLRMTSYEASKLFDNYSLDFVYIDANHTYESALEDINLWYPKVKINGIVAGHDFLDLPDYNKENYSKGIKNLPIHMWNGNDKQNSTYAGMFGVNPAVEEFTESHGYKFQVTKEWLGTWWFIKK